MNEALLKIRDEVVQILVDLASKISDLIENFIKSFKKAETKAKIEKMNADLWMYPPVVESEIHPFVFDERCEKCAKKATHKRRYVPLSKLLLTECKFCGATWWQRPADYNETVQISGLNCTVGYPLEFSKEVAENMKAIILNQSELTTKGGEGGGAGGYGIAALRHFKDGSTEKDDENAA